MSWIASMVIGAIIAILLPMMLGGANGVWMTGWTKVGTFAPFAKSPGLLFSVPVFVFTAIALRIFFNWHRN